jgi:urease accessory protein
MRSIALLLLSSLIATPALAHHPLGGMPMETFTHGILSGIGHPLLGFDHLFFIAAVGIAAIYTRSRSAAPLAYIAAMLAGCLLSSLWSSALASELMIALSLLVLGSMLLSGRRFGDNTILLGFAGFGLFHGAAFGVSIAAQEAAIGVEVLIGYLLGLGFTQYAIAIATGSIFIAMWKTAQPAAMQTRLAGAMVAGAGLYLTLEQVEGPLISLISS